MIANASFAYLIIKNIYQFIFTNACVLVFQPNQTMEANVLVTLKGDVVETYKILLRAMILSE